MKEIKLTPRLAAVAGFVPAGADVADVGTDHGYIPVWLAQRGLARRIVAADVKKGPLARARASAEHHGVADRVEFVLTDGLDGLGPPGPDTVLLAGMGGETMVHILGRAGWLRDAGARVILQPQTKWETLADWLGSNGYGLYDAALVRDDGRLYIVLAARAGDTGETPLRLLLQKRDALLPDLLDRLIAKRKRAAEGLAKAAGDHAQALRAHSDAYETLLRIREETDRWPR